MNPAIAIPEALQGALDTLDGLRMLPAWPCLDEVANLTALLTSTEHPP